MLLLGMPYVLPHAPGLRRVSIPNGVMVNSVKDAAAENFAMCKPFIEARAASGALVLSPTRRFSPRRRVPGAYRRGTHSFPRSMPVLHAPPPCVDVLRHLRPVEPTGSRPPFYSARGASPRRGLPAHTAPRRGNELEAL
jgi:hypothetical protein